MYSEFHSLTANIMYPYNANNGNTGRAGEIDNRNGRLWSVTPQVFLFWVIRSHIQDITIFLERAIVLRLAVRFKQCYESGNLEIMSRC